MTHPNLENRTSSTYLPKGAIALTPVKTVAIPVYGYVHAGEMSDADTIEARKQNIPEDIELRNPGCFGLIVEGDCMDKVYPEGCLIVVSPSKIPQNGSIVCFQDEDYRMVMRRYYRGANTLVLSPDSFNSEHVDIVYDDPEGSPIKVLGVVVWWQAAEEME
jgi:repressor LexA